VSINFLLIPAMPSQLIPFLTADRCRLDTEHLAVCVFLDTTVSFVTIPLVQALRVPSLWKMGPSGWRLCLQPAPFVRVQPAVSQRRRM